MVSLNLNLSEGENYISHESRELNASPKATIVRIETNKGVISNIISDANGKVTVTSNYGFLLTNEGVYSDFSNPNTEFVDKF